MAATTPNAQGQALFPENLLRRPMRTYSHRKPGNEGLLPRLRENPPAKTRIEQTPAGPASQRKHGLHNAQEVVPDRDSSDRSVDVEEEFDEEYDKEYDGYEYLEVAEERRREVLDTVEAKSDHYEEYDNYGLGDSSESNKSVYSEGEDKDDTTSSTPASSIGTLSSKQYARPPSSKSRTIRRRPYLIFNRTPTRGFKKLTPKSKTQKTPVSRRERPGDGFSDGEARPEGLVQVLGKRKLPPSAISGAGILTLTQSSPIIKAKPRKKVNRVEDNSFATASRENKRPFQPRFKKQDGQAANEVLGRRPISAQGLDTIEAASAPYGAELSMILGDTPEQEQDPIEKRRATNEQRKKERSQEHQSKVVGRNDDTTASDAPVDKSTDHSIFPCVQPPDGPARTWDTYIEESSPFRQRCGSDGPVEVLQWREGLVTARRGRRVLRRAKTR